MEISLTQCCLMGIWTGFCLTGMLTGTYLTRCLVMATGVGIILGDVKTGLLMGAAGELAFLGFGVSSGGSVPPNPAGPGIIGAIVAITMKDQGVNPETALAISFPFAVMIQFLITGIYTISTGFAARAEKAAEKGKYGQFRLLANGTFLMFVAAGFVFGFMAAFQINGLERLVQAIPSWLTDGLGTAGKMLPAVGFAVILSVMAGWDTIPFLLLGYVAAAYLKLPVLAVALSSAALAWLAYERGQISAKENEEEKGSRTEENKTDNLRIPEKELRRLSRKTALRAYFLQNGYNYGNYEGLSYANIMLPALRKICTDERELRQELKDSMGYCSVNPNFLPILTSIQLATMNRGMSGKESRDIRLALMGPLAGIGDSLVQFCLAPIFSTMGAAMAQEGLIAGPAVFLLGMNGLLLTMKLFSEELGYKLGVSLAERLKSSMDSLSGAARMVGTAVITALAVDCVDIRLNLTFGGAGRKALEAQEFLDALLPGILPVVYTGLLFYLIRKRRWSMYRLVVMTLLLGVGLNMAGIFG